MPTTREIQAALIAKGYNVGPTGVDGILGPKTTSAIRALQKANGLNPDGIVGANTAALLFPGSPDGKVLRNRDIPLPWYDEAKRHLGLKETKGPKTNPTIAEWLEELDASWDDDETPWCGTFVGHCIASTLPDEPLPNNPFGARNWAKVGKECEPQVGSIMVFWRGSKSGWSGHVGFYAGEDKTNYHILGGNQSDAVTVAKVAKNRFLNSRWPATAHFLQTGKGRSAEGVVEEGSEA